MVDIPINSTYTIVITKNSKFRTRYMATGNPSADDLVNGIRKEMGLKQPSEGQKPVVKSKEIGPGDIRDAWLALRNNRRNYGTDDVKHYGAHDIERFRRTHQLTEDRQLTPEEKSRIVSEVTKILVDDAKRVVDKRKEHIRLKERYAEIEREHADIKHMVVSPQHPLQQGLRSMEAAYDSLVYAKETLRLSLDAVETLGFTEEEIPELKAHRELLKESDEKYKFQ